MRVWTVEEQRRWEISADTREEALAVYALLEPVDTVLLCDGEEEL